MDIMEKKTKTLTVVFAYIITALFLIGAVVAKFNFNNDTYGLTIFCSFVAVVVALYFSETLALNTKRVFNTLKSWCFNILFAVYCLFGTTFNIVSLAYMGKKYQRFFLLGILGSIGLFYGSIEFLASYGNVSGVAEVSNFGMVTAVFFVLYTIYKSVQYVINAGIKYIYQKKGFIREKTVSFAKDVLYLVTVALKLTIPVSYVTLLFGILYLKGEEGTLVVSALLLAGLASYIIVSCLQGLYESRTIIAQTIKYELKVMLHTYNIEFNLSTDGVQNVKEFTQSYSNEIRIDQSRQLSQYGDYAGLTVKGISSKNIHDNLIEYTDSINDSYSIINIAA